MSAPIAVKVGEAATAVPCSTTGKVSVRTWWMWEKALEEKTRGVETAMAIARRQIAYQEERYEALVKEYEALKARSGET